MARRAGEMELTAWGDRKDDVSRQCLSWDLKAACKAGKLKSMGG